VIFSQVIEFDLIERNITTYDLSIRSPNRFNHTTLTFYYQALNRFTMVILFGKGGGKLFNNFKDNKLTTIFLVDIDAMKGKQL